MTTPDSPRPDDHSDEDIDAEFARLMEGMDLGSAPEPEPSAPSPFDELLEEDEGQEPSIAVVATSVATAKALAGAVRLGREARTDGIDVPVGTRVLDTASGAIAAGPLPELAAHDLAAVVSTALQRHGVVLFWRRGDRMTATRYKLGERGEDVSPAIVLGAVDDVVEQLLLGATDLDDLGEGLDPATITRSQALQWIARGGRKE